MLFLAKEWRATKTADMKTRHFFLLVILCVFAINASAQTNEHWGDLMNQPGVNFYEKQAQFNQYWEGKAVVKGNGWKQFKRWENKWEPRLYPTGKFPEHYNWLNETSFFRDEHRGGGADSADWSPMGPEQFSGNPSYTNEHGRINTIVQDPSDTSTLYVGTPAGGLWKTTDGGSSWTPLTDWFAAIGVSAIAVDPNDPNTIYVGTGDSDAGDTPSIGVMKSTDGGLTWNPTGLTYTVDQGIDSKKLMFHPTNNNILFLASNDGLLKTTDGGNTWTTVITLGIYDFEFHPTNPDTMYAVGGGTYYKSVDGGNNFGILGNGLPTSFDVNRYFIAVSAAAPDNVYILANNNDYSYKGLYRSTDAGVSFSQMSNSPNIFSWASDGSGSGGQSWYDMALAVNPYNPDEIFVGGVNVWRSLDGGQSWTIQGHWWGDNAPYVHADIHYLVFFDSVLYCGNDGGIVKTYDRDTIWFDLSDGLNISQYYGLGGSPQTPGFIMAGAQDNGTDFFDGSEWHHWSGGDGMDTHIDYSNDDIRYISGYGGHMARFENNGNDYYDIRATSNESASWVIPYQLDPSDPQTLYAGYRNVWKTQNKGASWQKISNLPISVVLNCLFVAPSNNDYIYVSDGSLMWMTSDHGTNWQQVNSGLPNLSITSIAAHHNNPLDVYVTLSGYNAGNKVYHSTDGGTNWSNITMNLPNVPANHITIQQGGNEGLYVGMDAGVYYYDDNLADWQPFMMNLPNVIVNELEINYAIDKIRAATFGRGVWESDLYVPSNLAPQANFVVDKSAKCPGDSIQFTDISLFGATSWQWSFPGGTPATSIDQHPVISYSVGGTYTASLIVNGSDTITKTFEANIGNNQMLVNIFTDDYPAETSWSMNDDAGIEMSAQPVGAFQNNQFLYTDTICLMDGCYDFTIFDGYGDGICCNYGQGYILLTNIFGDTLAYEGNFTGSSQTFNFCLPLATSIDDDLTMIDAIRVYPNPVNDELSIVAPSSLNGIQVDVINALGQTLESRVCKGVQRETLNVASLQQGIYFVRLSTATSTRTLRVVKK